MRLLFLIIISSIFFTSAQESTAKEDFFKSGICLSGDCKIDYGVKKFNDGTAYFGSWSTSHKIPSFHLDLLEKVPFIWISHFHPDHLNLRSLLKLKAREKTIY